MGTRQEKEKGLIKTVDVIDLGIRRIKVRQANNLMSKPMLC
jgi:hypothetical protein